MALLPPLQPGLGSVRPNEVSLKAYEAPPWAALVPMRTPRARVPPALLVNSTFRLTRRRCGGAVAVVPLRWPTMRTSLGRDGPCKFRTKDGPPLTRRGGSSRQKKGKVYMYETIVCMKRGPYPFLL